MEGAVVEEVLEVVSAEEIVGELMERVVAFIVEQEEARPQNFMEVPFEEYTVSEGLLLLLLFFWFVSAMWKMVRGCFNW